LGNASAQAQMSVAQAQMVTFFFYITRLLFLAIYCCVSYEEN